LDLHAEVSAITEMIIKLNVFLFIFKKFMID
jgi:hypothetical protein